MLSNTLGQNVMDIFAGFTLKNDGTSVEIVEGSSIGSKVDNILEYEVTFSDGEVLGMELRKLLDVGIVEVETELGINDETTDGDKIVGSTEGVVVNNAIGSNESSKVGFKLGSIVGSAVGIELGYELGCGERDNEGTKVDINEDVVLKLEIADGGILGSSVNDKVVLMVGLGVEIKAEWNVDSRVGNALAQSIGLSLGDAVNIMFGSQ